MQISGANIIGYTESSSGSQTFQTFNPAENRSNETSFFEAVESEVQQALALAEKAFPIYAQKPVADRIAFLKRIVSLLLENQNMLIQHYVLESGLAFSRGETELKRTCVQIETFLKVIEAESWPIQSEETAPNGIYFQKRFAPLGPVVVFGASNFPFAYSTIGGDAASALVAGCPVIVKSHSMHAGTGYLVSKLIIQAALETGMPDGVFSNLQIKDHQLTAMLVKHPCIKAVAFTGSISGGMALVAYAQTRKDPIPIFCEMGSLNPVFLFPSAIHTKSQSIAKAFSDSITQDSGQFCTKPGLLFLIENEEANQFIEELFKEINSKPALLMLGPTIYHNFMQGSEAEEKQFANKSREISDNKSQENYGLPLIDVISLDDFKKSAIWQEEVFGPYALIIRCKTISDFQDVAKMLSGQLTATIWAEPSELEMQETLLFEIQRKVGRIIFNGVSTGVQVIDSMHHGGSFPATTDSRFTAVGKDAIYRFLKSISFQGFPKTHFDKKT
ncbi:MAG: aldehyde dehydrogenase (NADP(+)) [Crocinitomicaceae bacterium]|nr:aldehyde dehydrogenase (NADP(+)) [Crocinitomicaceae bacterium]